MKKREECFGHIGSANCSCEHCESIRNDTFCNCPNCKRVRLSQVFDGPAFIDSIQESIDLHKDLTRN